MKKTKPVLAWGIKIKNGRISKLSFPSKENAQFECDFEIEEVVRVQITEVVSRET